MAAEEQPGVLGNLPRSRPGQRSSKRSASATSKPRPAAERAATTARKRSATRKPPAPRAERSSPPTPEPAAGSSPDLVTAPIRVAVKVAEVGLKTAGGILRRLPGR